MLFIKQRFELFFVELLIGVDAPGRAAGGRISPEHRLGRGRRELVGSNWGVHTPSVPQIVSRPDLIATVPEKSPPGDTEQNARVARSPQRQKPKQATKPS